MSEHTPGPWTLDIELDLLHEPDEDGDFWLSIDGPDGCVMFHCAKWQMKLADGRLMAAAPDLLEALEAMLETPNAGDSMAKASRAIAKAKGGVMSETSVRLIYAALLVLGSILAGYGIYLAEKADKQRRSLARRMRIAECWGDREDVPEPKGGFGSRSWRLE